MKLELLGDRAANANGPTMFSAHLYFDRNFRDFPLRNREREKKVRPKMNKRERRRCIFYSLLRRVHLWVCVCWIHKLFPRLVLPFNALKLIFSRWKQISVRQKNDRDANSVFASDIFFPEEIGVSGSGNAERLFVNLRLLTNCWFRTKPELNRPWSFSHSNKLIFCSTTERKTEYRRHWREKSLYFFSFSVRTTKMKMFRG